MEKRTYRPGETIYAEGDESTSVFLIKSGRVELVDTYPETGEVVSQSLNGGKVFGEIELMERKPRSATARATEESRILIFNHDEIMNAVFNDPTESLFMARNVFDRLRQLYSSDSIDSEVAKLREEMHETIKKAVISHEARVVKSHNGMAAIAIPIVLLVLIVIGIQIYIH